MPEELEVGEKVWFEACRSNGQPVDVPGTVVSVDGGKVWVDTTIGRLCVGRDNIKRQDEPG